MGDFCSPSLENKKKTCFSKESLLKLIETWNKSNPSNKIIYKPKSNNKILWDLLDNKLKGICSKGEDWCWTGAIEQMTTNTDLKKDVKDIAKKELKPEKPKEWLENPKTWLSNYDIENVMNQYELNKQYKYKFLGVYPIDFSVKNQFGKCLFSEICSLNIERYIKKGIKYLGLVTNLDKHDQPGSHWTSTFIIIDPKLNTYGAYYYDSTARNIPTYVLNFLKQIKAQCDLLYPDKKFIITYNKKQHQRKNTECGVFSILFQIRWLRGLFLKKESISFDYVIGDENITDDNMTSIRDTIFRPNIKSIIKNKV